MAKITVSRKKDTTEVIYKLEKEESLNEMELDIVSKHEIPFLIPGAFASGVLGRRIIVRIEKCTELRRYLSQGIDFDSFLTCVRQVICAVQECESHGVRSQNLDLNMDHCFIDTDSSEIRLCFWPVLTLNEYSDPEKFLKEMAACYAPMSCDRDDFAEYNGIFTVREKFDTHWFQNQLEQHFSETERTVRPVQGTESSLSQTVIPSLLASIGGNWKKAGCAVLLRKRTNTTVPLPSFPITLGRAGRECGCMIADNPYIGSRHITFYKFKERFYARDEGARNESVIDGKILGRNGEMEIHDGSVLTLGGEEFVFFTQTK